MDNQLQKRITLLGSTGSIGHSTLELVRRFPESFSVWGLSANSSIETLVSQIIEFQPKCVALANESKKDDLFLALKEKKVDLQSLEFLFGDIGVEQLASMSDPEIVISAIVGAAALKPTFSAIQKGKRVGLANKECLVMAGDLLMNQAVVSGAQIIPIDSEHSAIFQCLQGQMSVDKGAEQFQLNPLKIDKVILTASGGPFLNLPPAEFENITLERALKHPNWDMGPKITIDSATMMNKGLEYIEAKRLFHLEMDQISVLIHPQSVIHSMVEFKDGQILSQLGCSDMKGPISYCLFFPDRAPKSVERLDLTSTGALEFLHPDLERFPCLQLAINACRQGGVFPAILNAANEVAVEEFLQEKIQFNDIPVKVEKVLEHATKDWTNSLNQLEEIIQADQWARERAKMVQL